LVPIIVDISLPQAFGRVRRVSGDFPPDDLLRNIYRNINFDQPGARQDFDPDLSFREIKVERLDNGTVKLSFKLDRPAHYLHWHIERRQSFGRRTTLLRQMQLTPPQYPIGP